MHRTTLTIIALVALAITSAVAGGMNNPVVGGKEMFPTKNIIENAVNSADHTTLVAAVKAAGLVETLEGAVGHHERDSLQQRFLDGEYQILVSTDAGGEGIDLQSAHVMIDWDIPWSLVRLEQRMGRLRLAHADSRELARHQRAVPVVEHCAHPHRAALRVDLVVDQLQLAGERCVGRAGRAHWHGDLAELRAGAGAGRARGSPTPPPGWCAPPPGSASIAFARPRPSAPPTRVPGCPSR